MNLSQIAFRLSRNSFSNHGRQSMKSTTTSQLGSGNAFRMRKVMQKLLILTALLFLAGVAQAQLPHALSIMSNLTHNDAAPNTPLCYAKDGNLYGIATGHYGQSGPDEFFRVNAAGTPVSDLVPLDSGTDGNNDSSPGQLTTTGGGLIQASDGNFYGLAQEGGSGKYGTIYKITHSTSMPYSGFAVSVLHSFTGGIGNTNNSQITPTNDGGYPCGNLVEVSDTLGDNLYGTTYEGGLYNDGCIFRISIPKGNSTATYTTIFSFSQGSYGELGSASNGVSPAAGLIWYQVPGAKTGYLYGTTATGGASATGTGVVFSVTTGGVLTVLHTFQDGSLGNKVTDGAYPESALALGPAIGPDLGPNEARALYGTTCAGGTYDTDNSPGVTTGGTVFRLTISSTSGSATGYSILHNFGGNSPILSGDVDGTFPTAALVLGTDGNLYGTTVYGGANTTGPGGSSASGGTVFGISIPEKTSTGTPEVDYSVLHCFGDTKNSINAVDNPSPPSDDDGLNPYGGLIVGPENYLYGTTFQGGTNPGDGTVFKYDNMAVFGGVYAAVFNTTDTPLPGLYYSPWFGYYFYFPALYPCIYHPQLGWTFVYTPNNINTWLWIGGANPTAYTGGVLPNATDKGWLYTDAGMWPNAYVWDLNPPNNPGLGEPRLWMGAKQTEPGSSAVGVYFKDAGNNIFTY
jgi:uncharacterized repeat protein (TIGR03803 family)